MKTTKKQPTLTAAAKQRAYANYGLAVEPSRQAMSWSSEGTLVDYGRAFLREREEGPVEVAHKQRVSALRWACGSR